MKNKGVVLFIVFLLSLVFITAVFAQSKQSARGDIYVGYFQIMNNVTKKIYQEGRFETAGRHFTVASAIEEMRKLYGCEPGTDICVINGVEHTMIWSNVRRK